MAEGGFRLPGTTYEELANIIVAYGTRDEASNPGDVGKLDSVHRASATRTNGFLVEVGVLRGEREKLVTPRGRELAAALRDQDEENIRRIWRQVVSTSEFLQNVVSAVKIREAIPYEAVQGYIAQAAGQPRNKPVMIGSATVIEVLKASNLLHESEAGSVFAVREAPRAEFLIEVPDGVSLTETPDEDPFDPPEETAEDPQNAVSSGFEDSAAKDSGPSEEVSVVVNVHLHVRCEARELDEVSPKLQALIRTLREQTPEVAVKGDLSETPDERSLDLDAAGFDSDLAPDGGDLDDFFSSGVDENWGRGSSGRSF